VSAVAFLFLLVSFYTAELFTRSKRRRVEGTPDTVGLRFEDVQLRTPDNVILRGWFVDSPGARATVIVVHDGTGTRTDLSQGLLALQRDYVSRGFNVFAFDLRGRGESSGKRDRLGSGEQRDVAVAISYVRRRTEGLPIVLHGFGLGASLAIATVAAGAPAEAVIADSPFASAREQLRFRWSIVPGVIFDSACWIARRLYSADVDSLKPQEAISSMGTTPVLMIHGDADEDVPLANSLNIAAATLNEGIELWVVPDAQHCRAYVDNRDAYLRRCLDFIEVAVPRRLLASAG
jgi:alpha/beta superfamily hydrolase